MSKFLLKNKHIFFLLIFILLIFPNLRAHCLDKKPEILKIKTREVLRIKTGSGSDNLGIILPDEANPEGPMSFALGKDGEIYILDQLNFRIQVFKNNKRIKTIPIPKDKSLDFKDLEVTPENKIVLAGEFFKEGRAEKTYIYMLDLDGKVLNLIKTEPCPPEIHIVAEGQYTGIWLCSKRIASIDGKETDRIRVPGKLSSDSKRIIDAKIIGEVSAVLYRSEENCLSRWEPEVTVYFNMPIVNLLGIWDDIKGRIYLGAFLADEKRGRYSNLVIIFSSDLREIGRVKLMVSGEPYEIWRSVKVSPEGSIYQLYIDKKQYVVIKKYEPNLNE